MSQVVILKTTPQTILQDYARLMHLAEYEKNLSKDTDLLLKLNLSWTKFFPACSTPPWQLEGVVKTLLDDGFDKNRIFPVENKTVVTNPWQGAKENKWLPILEKYGLKFTALPEVEWVKYDFKSDLLVLNKIFPEGIYIPKMFIGKQVLHLPTVKCVHPDTEIFLSDGSLIKIKELVKNVQKKRGVIVTSDKDRVSESNHNLPTLNIEGKITRGKAYQFWETPAPQYGVKIKTRTGREVIVSEEHPFLTPKGWEKAKSLHPNNRIAIPRRISIKGESQLLPELRQPKPNDLNLDKINFHNGRKFSASVQKKFLEEYFDGKEIKKTAAVYGMSGAAYKSIFKRYNIPHRSQRNWLVKTPRKTSPEFWRWVGYFTAEGHLDGDDYFIFVNSDPDIQKDYVSLGRRLFNIDIEFKRGKDAQFRSVQLREFFQKLGWQVPLLAGNKRAPRLLFKCPQEEIAAFLQGYFEGDGCMVERTIGNKLIMYLYATTKSHQLARDLLYLLLRLGVVAFKRKTRKHATNTKMRKRTYYNIFVRSHELVELSRYISFLNKEKQKRLEKFLKRKRNTNWDTIPLDPDVMKQIRESLGLLRKEVFPKSTGMIAAIKDSYRLPSRQFAKEYIARLKKFDTKNRLNGLFAHLDFLMSDDLAWDQVEECSQQKIREPFLYDLSVIGTNNFIGNAIFLHNTHGHSQVTISIKNSFGGLLRETRHYCHQFIHETLVDLMYLQKEIHPAIFAVADGTVAGDGAGPRTMMPKIKNVILASADSVAIDAVSAKLMGLEPMEIPYLRMCQERGLGVADIDKIEIVGDTNVAQENWGFQVKKSFVIWGDQMLRRGKLKFLEKIALRSFLWRWAPMASNIYHDLFWYPTVGKKRINKFMKTEWGELFQQF